MKKHIQLWLMVWVLASGIQSALAQPFLLSTSLAPSGTQFPHSVVAADVNGDGKLDLIYADSNSGVRHVSVLTNNGDGTFTLAASPSETVGDVYSVTAADMNGDGKVDLVCSISGGYCVVMTNTGSGNFSNCLAVTAGYTPLNLPDAVADVNGDGKPDIITPNYSGNTLNIITNKGGGVFVAATPVSTVAPSPVCVVAADVNGDGKVDLISANNGGTFTVLTNNGSGGFVLTFLIYGLGVSPFQLVSADVNGDGWPDLVTAGYNGSTYSLAVFTNTANGSGNFLPAAYTLYLPTGSTPLSVAVADINGDGWPDLIAANNGSASLTIYTNRSGKGFTLNPSAQTPMTVGVSNSPNFVIAADINGDGKLDLVTTHDGNLLNILTNNLPLPPLGIAKAGGQKVFYWAADGTNEILQSTTNLSLGKWLRVTNGSPFIGAAVTNNPAYAFFRLEATNVTTPVALNIARSNTQSIVYWSPSGTNYLLETTTNMADVTWGAASNNVPIIGVTVSNLPPNLFYRL